MSEMKNIDLERMGNSLDRWDFNSLVMGEDELLVSTFLVFRKMKIFELLPVSEEKIKSFILEIRLQYYRNPYHNFYHAVDVLQATMFIMKAINIEKMLRPIDIFALLISAYCHDVGHPGCNNFFLTNQGSVLSKIYNDRSVLENYHLMLLYSTLDRDECNIFSGFTFSERRELKGFITESILATDMAHHQEWIDKLHCRLNSCKSTTVFSLNNTKDRSVLGCCILKCADLNNVARPYPIHETWVACLMKEYLDQGKVENEMGLPVHPFGDANSFDQADSQIYFSQNLAGPFFVQFCTFFPNGKFDFYLKFSNNHV